MPGLRDEDVQDWKRVNAGASTSIEVEEDLGGIFPDLDDEPSRVLRTYCNYARAWAARLQAEYGTGEDGMAMVGQAVQSTRLFEKVQGQRRVSDELTSSYRRGILTLMALRELPLQNRPVIAPAFALWLPVQAYYAIQGVGLAAMAALGASPLPKKHGPFMAVFADQVAKYLPQPLSGLCVGGPEPKDFHFKGLDTTPKQVARQSNLALPREEGLDHYLGKSLSTTREKLLKEHFAKERRKRPRPGRSRRNLGWEQKKSLCDKLHPTSVCDLFYRMRLRSNYQDPDMYVAFFDDYRRCVRFYEDLLCLTGLLISALETFVGRGIGKPALASLKSGLGGAD